MRRMLWVATISFAITVASFLAGCGGTEYTKIKLRSRANIEDLCTTDTAALLFRVSALDDEGRNAVVDDLDPTLVPVWSSDDESIATVDAEGVVTMQSLGVASITVALETPTGTLTDSIAVSACDCLQPVTDPTRQMEALVTAPPVGSPTARMRARCPAPDTSAGTGCASYSGTLCWHEAIPASNTGGLGTWQLYHCDEGRVERRDEPSEWSILHTEAGERNGLGLLDDDGAPLIPGCSGKDELLAVDLRGGQPDDYYQCKCNP